MDWVSAEASRSTQPFPGEAGVPPSCPWPQGLMGVLSSRPDLRQINHQAWELHARVELGRRLDAFGLSLIGTPDLHGLLIGHSNCSGVSRRLQVKG